jgi:hypothetical protein
VVLFKSNLLSQETSPQTDMLGKPVPLLSVREISDVRSYWFYMNQVSITPPGATAPIALTSPTYNQPMFPDSGSTFCQLPSALFTALLAYFPVSQVNQGSNSYTVSCNYRTQAGYINFAFGSVTVSVSYHEFIWFDGVQCWFAAQPSTQFYLLGDSFMRSAYSRFNTASFPRMLTSTSRL